MQKPRYQIFISSTYEDMKAERQAAMMAILEKRHIPAGMEYFSAKYVSQFDVIRRWIEDCDIFLLILGGRYGTICEDTGKSYIDMEFDYAQKTEKPIIVLIAGENYVCWKKAEAYRSGNLIYENDRADLYNALARKMTRMRKTFDSIDKLKLEIMKAIDDIENDETLLPLLGGLVPRGLGASQSGLSVTLSKDTVHELLFYLISSAVFDEACKKMRTGKGYFASDYRELSTGEFDYYNYEEVFVKYRKLRLWPHAEAVSRKVQYIDRDSANQDMLEETVRFRFSDQPEECLFKSVQMVEVIDGQNSISEVCKIEISYLGITVKAKADKQGRLRDENDELLFSVDYSSPSKKIMVSNPTKFVKYIVASDSEKPYSLIKILPGSTWKENAEQKLVTVCDTYEEAEEKIRAECCCM